MTSNTAPMNPGSGNSSYFKNSHLQRIVASTVKEKINQEITEKFDPKNQISNKTYKIADLGCATGPNTFITMLQIVEAINQNYKTQYPNSSTTTNLEYQLFFNDLPTNDFNTLFTSLPKDMKFYVAGVPGSYHDRLFPSSSVHLMHSAFALHFLSKLPIELQEKDSCLWNKGRVHYTNAPQQVYNSYSSQFHKDMERFLEARAEEIVVGGLMIIVMLGISKDLSLSNTNFSLMFDSMAFTLKELALEGKINESELDSFNLPMYIATPEEMMGLVEKNGHFSIERLELFDPASWLQHQFDIRAWILSVRAALEGHFTKQFGTEIMDEFFERLIGKIVDQSELVNSMVHEKLQLFVVLKRQSYVDMK